MIMGRAPNYFYWFTTAFAAFWVAMGFLSLWAVVYAHAAPTGPFKIWLTALIVWLGGWLIRRRYGEKSN